MAASFKGGKVEAGKSLGSTGILVHGCHLQAVEWKDMVWGLAPDKPGRIIQGIYAALEADGGWFATENNEAGENGCVALVFGTGASSLPDGRLEAQVTVDLMWENFAHLREFDLFWDPGTAGVRPNTWWDAIRMRLEELVIVETTSQNTQQEVEAGARAIEGRGGARMVLVSSQTHISRCLRDAIAALEARKSPLRFHLFATAASTTYAGSTVTDVVIMEPPHRADRDHLRLDVIGKRMLGVKPEEKAALIEDFTAILEKYGL